MQLKMQDFTAQLLIERGADVSILDENEKSPEDYAMEIITLIF